VPYFEWQGMDKRAERRRYITAALYQAGWRGPDEDREASQKPASQGSAAEHSVAEGASGEGVVVGRNTPRQEGVDVMRERERRLSLLHLERKAGAKSTLLQRQKIARRKR